MHHLAYSFDNVSKINKIVRNSAVTLLFMLLISLSGRISIPLFFTPVPIVLQSHVILFAALFLGSKRVTIATVLFLAQGALGMPVFAEGVGGISYFLGPSGGYFWGYLIGAFVTGLVYENSQNKGSSTIFIAMALGNLVIFLLGYSWLTTYVGIKSAFLLGVLPFIACDLLKLMVFTRLYDRFKRSVLPLS